MAQRSALHAGSVGDVVVGVNGVLVEDVIGPGEIMNLLVQVGS